MRNFTYWIASLCVLSPQLWSANITVNTTADNGTGSLPWAISTAANGDTIKFSLPANSTITLTSGDLPVINVSNLTIDGSEVANLTVSGGNSNRIFFVDAANVTIQNLILSSGNAMGGPGGLGTNVLGGNNNDGGSGGGGGLGAGGAVFAGSLASNLTLTNITFSNNTASGGAGGAPGVFVTGGGGGGGGGGLKGSGGQNGSGGELNDLIVGAGGGGGGGYPYPISSSFVFPSDGSGGGDAIPAIPNGGNGGAGAGNIAGGAGGPNTSGPGGPGGTVVNSGQGGGGGGGATGDTVAAVGGAGGSGVGAGPFSYGAGGGGGGGGGDLNTTGGVGGAGGAGGFGAGGGGGGSSAYGGGIGGAGGFGAGGGGGGGGSSTAAGASGFGGGTASGGANTVNGYGGGGAAFGGAIFIRQGASVNLGGILSFSNIAPVAGTDGNGATTATASSTDLFINSGSSVAFSLSSPLTISTVISSDNLNPAGSFTVSGTSILTLSAANSYLANNIISSGTLAIASDASLGVSSNTVTLGGGTLKTATASGTITTARPISISAFSTIDVNGGSFTASGVISGNALQIVSSSSSSGTFTPSNNSNTFNGLTMSSGSVLISNAGQIGAGTLTFNGGTLQSSTTLSLANAITTNAGTTSTLQVNGNTTLTLSSPITGAGRINFINNAFSTTSVLQLGVSSPSFTGTLGLGGPTGGTTLLAGSSITLPNNFVFGSGSTINMGANTLTLSGTLSGSAVNITDGGSNGTLALASASNSANATLNLNSGRLQVNNSNVGTLNLASGTTLQFGVTALNLSRPIAGSGIYTIDTQGFSETISSAISGSGFTKIGSGTLILTNANTYSGLTTVSAGTLQINTDSNLGVAPSVSLATGATLLIGANLTSNATIALAGNATINAGAFALTLNNPITGGNALTSTGTGTLTLAAGNSLSATTVLGGTLAINDGSTGNLTLASGVNLNVLASTTFASTISLGGSNPINIATNTFNVSGNISGTGPLIKNGRGVLILGGTNTYNGGTQINQGTLQIGADTALGTGTLSLSSATLKASAPFTLNHAMALTGSNFIDTNGFNVTEQAVISGTGTLNKIGAGTLTFTAVNTYSGQTIIQTGTLALSGSGQLPATPLTIASGAILDISAASSPQTIRSLSGSGDINLGAQQLTLGSSTESTTFAGSFTGTGNLVKDGTATLSLSQSSPGYSGAVTITQGTLNLLNISLPGSINIQLNGVLSGTGSVGSVTNAGTISPGNSIGTINILGNYVQTGTGTLVSEVSASSADLLQISGTAMLNGALNVVVYPGTYLIGNTKTLVNAAGGVSGAWTSNNLNTLDVAFGIQYTATQAQLIVLENNIFFGRDIEGFNPNAVAQYFTDVVPSSDSALSDILLQLGELSSSELTHALDTMHPAQMGAIRLIRESQSAMLSDLLAYRVEELCCQRLETAPKCAPTALWIEPYDQFLRIDSIDEQKGFNANTVGFALGADHCFSSGIALGLASGYSYTDLNWMKSAGSGTLHSVFAGIYSDWLDGPFSLNTSIIGAKDFFDVTRHIFFPGFSAKAKSDHDAWEYDVHVGTGYDYPIHTWTSSAPVVYMRPFADFDYFNIYEDSFKESGAGVLDLDVQNKHSQFLRSQLGIQLSRSMSFSKGCWSPSLYLSWINIHTFSNRNYVSSYTGFEQTFTVRSYQRNWNLFSPGFDFSVNFNSGLILVMKYEAQFNGSYMIQQGNVRFEWSF